MLLFVILGLRPDTARAQYMYLDANGNGIHDSGDQMNASGPTTVDIWLNTSESRDGTPASCGFGSGNLTMNSYEVILRASCGAVSWGPLERHDSLTVTTVRFGRPGGDTSDPTYYHDGWSGTPADTLPPGVYHLARIVISVVSGAPAIEIAAADPRDGAAYTSFGTQCSANDEYDHTYKLGANWFDVDGLQPPSTANTPPSVSASPNTTVSEGSFVSLSATASDPDAAEFVSLSQYGMPATLTFTPASGSPPVTATITGNVGFQDAGVHSINWIATDDGCASSIATTVLTVTDFGLPPSVAAPATVSGAEGAALGVSVTASDPDGDAITSLTASPLPTGATFTPAAGNTSGELSWTPGFTQAGSYGVTFTASNALSGSATTTINVTDTPRPPVVVAPSITVDEATEVVLAVTANDPDGDAIQTLSVNFSTLPSGHNAVFRTDNPARTAGTFTWTPTFYDAGNYSLTFTATNGLSGSATSIVTVLDAGPWLFAAKTDYVAGTQPRATALGDVNRDGKLDIVSANQGSANVSVLLGTGGGSFGAPTQIVVGTSPQSVALADLNGNGTLDIAVVNNGSSTASVLLGNGDGTFQPSVNHTVGSQPNDIVPVDLNRDGKLDLATSSLGTSFGLISVLIGDGSGGFASHVEYTAGSALSSIEAGDVNRDGIPDLVAADGGGGSVSLMPGNGDGTLGARIPVLIASGVPSRVAALGDVNGDARLDLVVGSQFSSTVYFLPGNGDGTFGSSTSLSVGGRPYAITIADVDGDGNADAMSANQTGATVSVLPGRGDGTFGSRLEASTGSGPTSLSCDDLDSDGRLDLVAAHPAGVSVLLGNRNVFNSASFGTATDLPVGSGPNQVVAGDWNRDGAADLAVSNVNSNTVSILLGNGTGSFVPMVEYGTGTNPYGVTSDDFNRDGHPDLVVTNTNASSIGILLGDGTGSFGPRVDYTTTAVPSRVATGDLNRDGKTDIVVTSGGTNTLSVFLGMGNGGFGSRVDFGTALFPQHTALADFNRDGILDAAVPNYSSGSVSVFPGIGDGTFGSRVDYPTGTEPRSVAVGHLNGDGWLDLAVANQGANTISILFGGVSGFGAATNMGTITSPLTVSLEDMNQDGRLDLLVSHPAFAQVSLRLGDGNGGFGLSREFATGSHPFLFDVADLNGDSRPDIVTANYVSNSVSVLLNQQGSAAMDPNLVAYWRLNGSAVDAIQGNELSVTGSVTYGGGRIGSGADIQGTESYLQGPTRPEYSLTAAGFTVEFWAKVRDLPGANPRMIQVGAPSMIPSWQVNLCRLNCGSGRVSFFADPILLTSRRRIDDGLWHHLAATYDGGSMRIFVDGVMDTALFQPGLAVNVTGGTTTLGANPGAPDQFDGVLDELRIWNVARTGPQIQASMNAEIGAITAIEEETSPPPAFALWQNRPNPFNPRTVIQFGLPGPRRVRLDVYDAHGRLVSRLLDQPLPEGLHRIDWDGTDRDGERCASGVYFYRIQAGRSSESRRMVLLR